MPLTLRQLVWMVEGKIGQAWNHTAALLAMLANLHRDRKKTRPVQPSAFHPMANTEHDLTTDEAIVVDKQTIHLLKHFFTGDAL